MRRTKGWWAQLTAEERSTIVYLERADKHGGSGWNLPPGYRDCGGCSQPTMFNICIACGTRLDKLIAKANNAMEAGG